MEHIELYLCQTDNTLKDQFQNGPPMMAATIHTFPTDFLSSYSVLLCGYVVHTWMLRIFYMHSWNRNEQCLSRNQRHTAMVVDPTTTHHFTSYSGWSLILLGVAQELREQPHRAGAQNDSIKKRKSILAYAYTRPLHNENDTPQKNQSPTTDTTVARTNAEAWILAVAL